jgi:hypothetical protein
MSGVMEMTETSYNAEILEKDYDNKKYDHHQNDGKTHRDYPERNKEKKKKGDKFFIEVFMSKVQYDKDNISKGSEKNDSWDKHKDPTYISPTSYSYYKLWRFANEIFGTNLDRPDTPKFPGKDLSYQELADELQCVVIVNKNLRCQFDKDTGETDASPPRGFGGGSAQATLYYQRGYSKNIGDDIEDPKLRTWYHPTLFDSNDIPITISATSEKQKIPITVGEKTKKRFPISSIKEPDPRVVQIYPPLEKENFQFKTQMNKAKPRTAIAGPCMCCYRNDGRIWMMKGTGEKAYCKNKGMHKHKFREYEILDNYKIDMKEE